MLPVTMCNPLSLSLCVSDSFVFAVSTPTFTTVHEYSYLNETAFLYVFCDSNLSNFRLAVMCYNEIVT